MPSLNRLFWPCETQCHWTKMQQPVQFPRVQLFSGGNLHQANRMEQERRFETQPLEIVALTEQVRKIIVSFLEQGRIQCPRRVCGRTRMVSIIQELLLNVLVFHFHQPPTESS